MGTVQCPQQRINDGGDSGQEAVGQANRFCSKRALKFLADKRFVASAACAEL